MGRSGVQVVSAGQTGTFEPRGEGWLPLADVADDSYRSRVVRLRVDRVGSADPSAPPLDPHALAWLPAGAWWSGWVDEDHAVVRIKSEAYGQERALLIDLRSGDYQLPPTGKVTVEVQRYHPGDQLGDLAGPLRVSCTIVDGATSDVTPLLLTAPRRFRADESGEPARAGLIPPQGAYAFELLPGLGQAFTEGYHGVYRDRRFDGADAAAGLHSPPSSPIVLTSPLLSVADMIGAEGSRCVAVFFVR